MAFKLTWKELFPKLLGGLFLGMIGIVLGHFTGMIFEGMNILTNLPWFQFLAWLGGLVGFLIGTQIE